MRERFLAGQHSRLCAVEMGRDTALSLYSTHGPFLLGFGEPVEHALLFFVNTYFADTNKNRDGCWLRVRD